MAEGWDDDAVFRSRRWNGVGGVSIFRGADVVSACAFSGGGCRVSGLCPVGKRGALFAFGSGAAFAAGFEGGGNGVSGAFGISGAFTSLTGAGALFGTGAGGFCCAITGGGAGVCRGVSASGLGDTETAGGTGRSAGAEK
ncbi:MAG: hypothetical protein ACOCW9_02630 [Thermodesulfobacteriota bacterium]